MVLDSETGSPLARVSAGLVERSSARGHTLTLVTAADERYAMPLAVTMYSAGESLGSGQQIEWYILDGGISESSWMALRETLAGLPIDVQRVRPDASRVDHLTTSHHITPTAYFRLMTADLLPARLDRALYLDADLVVREDLGNLWREPLGSAYCLAAVDIACPYVDARFGRNYRRACPYMASLMPIRNYAQLGLNANDEYFNSGVMVLNLARWRRESIGSRLIDCLATNQPFVWCWDQYALNVTFAGQWGRLAPRWNQGAHAFEYPTVDHSPIDVAEFDQMRREPAIIHFTTEFKPWRYGTADPRATWFFETLDKTAWRGWRPPRPQFHLARWWQGRAVAIQKRWTISSRKVTARWRAQRVPVS